MQHNIMNVVHSHYSCPGERLAFRPHPSKVRAEGSQPMLMTNARSEGLRCYCSGMTQAHSTIRKVILKPERGACQRSAWFTDGGNHMFFGLLIWVCR